MLKTLDELTKIVCVESSHGITPGKSYDVYYLHGEVYIIDDYNDPFFISSCGDKSDFTEYFNTLSEIRDEKISDILK